jgi:hypothetical protein
MQAYTKGQYIINSRLITATDYYFTKWLRRDYKLYMSSKDIQRLYKDAHSPSIWNDPRIKYIPEIYSRLTSSEFKSGVMTKDQKDFFINLFEIKKQTVMVAAVLTFIDTQFDIEQTKHQMMLHYDYSIKH